MLSLMGSAVAVPAEPRLLEELRASAWARRAWRTLRWLACVLLAVTAVRAFLGEASVVPTASMERTILVGDHIFLGKLLHAPEVPLLGWRLPRLRQPRRGDIVAFRYPRDPNVTFLKRVIAVAGDRVEIRREVVYLNGRRLPEPYAQHRRCGRKESLAALTVPAGHLFVLGDNRDDSEDSRYWGTLPVENVIGEPLLVYWSFDAPSSAWLDRNHRLRFYASVATHLVSQTRWGRTGTLLR